MNGLQITSDLESDQTWTLSASPGFDVCREGSKFALAVCAVSYTKKLGLFIAGAKVISPSPCAQ